jgi:asparagine synthase (glutamine-hydrolysing)
MCGIVAVLSRNGPVCPILLSTMRDRLAHRGPDGADQRILSFQASQVGLAHRRLSILDLSEGGSQPMSNGSGDVWIVYNGEIYNGMHPPTERDVCICHTRSAYKAIVHCQRSIW